MSNQNWKKAQDRVQKVLKVFMDSRKDFYFKTFTDTYQAGGNVVQNQPSDLWFIFQSKFAICEIKSSEYKDKFYFKDVRPSQWIGAMRVLAAGGHSLFLIVKIPEWQWYFIPGRLMLTIKESGEAGIYWAQMTPIKLTAEVIVGECLERSKDV